MIKTNNKKTQAMVEKFLDIKNLINQKNEEMQSLRSELLKLLSDDGSMVVGDEFIVTRTERSRSDFDKEKLKEALGSKIDEYKIKSTYTVLEVKPC